MTTNNLEQSEAAAVAQLKEIRSLVDTAIAAIENGAVRHMKPGDRYAMEFDAIVLGNWIIKRYEPPDLPPT